jgi:hypothetical protein
MKTRSAGLAFVLLTFCGLFLTRSALANSLKFTLTNSTGRDIIAVYVSAHGADSWGQNLMNTVLRQGQDFPLSFDSDEIAPVYWDIKVSYVDGETAEWMQGFNLYRIATITLYFDHNGSPRARYVLDD